MQRCPGDVSPQNQCWRLPGFTISGNLPNTHPENLKWETSGKSHFPKFAAKRVTFLQHCPACSVGLVARGRRRGAHPTSTQQRCCPEPDMPCAHRPRQAPSTIVAHSELDAAGRHGCSGNLLAIHAAQRAQTPWAAHHVRVSASIHLWTRCCALMADTSRDLMICQAWPTRNTSILPL